jgi:di/tricarboxylate transporter
MLVPSGSQLVGRTIEQAGLRNLPGAYLVEIERNGDIIAAVGPEQVLRANDRLVFAGVVDSIRDLQNQRGLAPATDQVFKLNEPRYRRRLFEAVVSDTCAVVGRSIREGRFRTVYNAAVLAVARNGERVGGKIGDIVLRAGDMLLIEASPAFESQQRNSRDFFMVKTLEDSAPRRHERAWVAVVILVAMVTTAAMEWLDMLHVAMLAAAAMLLTRCCTITDARRSVDWSVLTVIAAALGLGAALEKSGAAKALAGSVLAAAGDNPWAVLAAVYIVTWVLTEFITNNAAVAMTFPIALATAKQLNVNFTPFIFAIMMAGSAGFTMPLGYQTHLMVYGPGGYVFKDFIKIGLPLSLIVAALTIVLTPLIWPLKYN